MGEPLRELRAISTVYLAVPRTLLKTGLTISEAVLFGLLWELAGFQPKTIRISVFALAAELGADARTVREWIQKLADLRLLDIADRPKARRQPWIIYVRDPSDAESPKPVPVPSRQSQLAVDDDPEDIAQFPPGSRPSIAQDPPGPNAGAEKSTAAEASMLKEFDAAIRARQQATPWRTAQDSLERSHAPTSPCSLSSDVPQERSAEPLHASGALSEAASRNVEKRAPTGTSPKGDELRRLVAEIQARFGRKDTGKPADDPSLPWGIALLFIDGPLPIAVVSGAFDSCTTWPQFVGAMRKQLALLGLKPEGREMLVKLGLWKGAVDELPVTIDEALRHVQLHRWKHIRQRCMALTGNDPCPPMKHVRQQPRAP